MISSDYFTDEYIEKEREFEKKIEKVRNDQIQFSDEFKSSLVEMSDSLNLDVSYLMTVFHVETIGTFKPSKKSPIGAVGLIQFTPSTARWLGTNTYELSQMSRSKQLKYVAKYFDNIIKYYGPLKSLEDVFMAVHYPRAIGKNIYSTVYKKGTAAYNANRFNDRNKDGKVTKYEICNFVRAIYNKNYLN
jgi:hypothetical protein